MNNPLIQADTDLNEASRIVHAANIKWWQNIDTGERLNRNRFEMLALIISESSECLEGERKGLMDDKLPHRKMAEVEMADAYIRLLDFSGGFGCTLSRVRLIEPVADNRGEALFRLSCLICRIGDSAVWPWLNFTLAYIEAYCLKHGYDLWGAINEKMAYNAIRVDHTHEARRIAGGKQF